MIKFHPRFNDLILSGEKTTTVRNVLGFYPGEIHACFNPDKNEPFAWIKILGSNENRIEEINVVSEGFKTTDELVDFLREVYNPSVVQAWWMFVIAFELTEAPDDK